jgi:hypothetical protein
LNDLVGFLSDINDRGIDLYLHKQGLIPACLSSAPPGQIRRVA